MNNHHARIAMIGTEGSGKTVFVTCLAKCFEGRGRNGRALEPMTKETPLYVDKNWRTLVSGEWPPLTNARDVFDLHWQLRVKGETSGTEEIYAVRVIDSAGHDLRNFFADEAINKIAELPDTLQPLAEYCREAEIVLIIVNLKDFMAPDEVERTTANQWAIKFALDYKYAHNPDAKCAMIFSQSDLHQDELAALGSWEAVAEKHLPHVYAAHLSSGKIPLLAVSAVNKTRQIMMEGGVTRIVPAADFGHDGFDPLIDWVAGQAKTAAETHEARELEKQQNALQAQIETQCTDLQVQIAEIDQQIATTKQTIKAKKDAAESTANRKALIPTLAASGVIFLLLMAIFTQVQTIQVPVNYSWTVEWGIFDDDLVVLNNDSFPYTNVRFHYTLQPSGRSPVSGDVSVNQIPPHGQHTFVNAFSVPRGTTGTASLQCSEQTQQHEVPLWDWIVTLQLAISSVLYAVLYLYLKKPHATAEASQLAKLVGSRQSLENQLQRLCNSQPDLRNTGPVPPLIPKDGSHTTVIVCGSCGQMLRVPLSAETIRIKCFACQKEFEHCSTAAGSVPSGRK